MKDPIERQAAIDAIGKASDELYENIKKGATFPQRQWFDGMAQAQSILENLPSAQPEPQWIPCSEMEPKKSGRYLCTHSGTGIVSPDYYTTQEQAEELFADPEDEYLDLEEYIGWTSKNVIAWMHRPEPWKGEQQ